MTDVGVDLADFDDSVLEASLALLFDQHEHATDAGDTVSCAEIHHAITAIVNEQARRTDAWIAERQS